MMYKGYEIKRVTHQDTLCYRVPVLDMLAGSIALAGSLKTAKRWVDQYRSEVAARKYYQERDASK